MNSDPTPRLYTTLAHWWPLFSPPSHYTEEAADLLPELLMATEPPPKTLLELGCGGGSLAWHLKQHFQLTLTDHSEEMLAVCQAVNPECELVKGDMRSLELGREFDLVLIHDAIMYLTDNASVQAALLTAFRHCRPGGAVIVMPDCVRETFVPTTTTGGEGGPDGSGLRYLEWTWDPDPSDDTFEVQFAFLLRESDGGIHVDSDRHRFGLFPLPSWLKWIEEAGFSVTARVDPWKRHVFLGKKPG